MPGFDLYSAIAECQRHLERFGGHPAAAGLDVRRDRLSAFRDAFADAANKRLTPDLLRPVLRLDMEIELSEAEESFVRWLRYLGPHGRGNPSPLFLARGVELTHAETVKGEASASTPRAAWGIVARYWLQHGRGPSACHAGRTQIRCSV